MLHKKVVYIVFLTALVLLSRNICTQSNVSSQPNNSSVANVSTQQNNSASNQELFFTNSSDASRQRNSKPLDKGLIVDPVNPETYDFGSNQLRKEIAKLEQKLKVITNPIQLYDTGIKDLVFSYYSELDAILNDCKKVETSNYNKCIETPIINKTITYGRNNLKIGLPPLMIPTGDSCDDNEALWALYSQYRLKFEENQIAINPNGLKFFYSILSSPQKNIVFFDVTKHNYLTIQRWVELKHNVEYGFPFSIGTTLVHVDNHSDCFGPDVELSNIINDASVKKNINSNNKTSQLVNQLFADTAKTPRILIKLQGIKDSFPNINNTMIGACCTGVSKNFIWLNPGDATVNSVCDNIKGWSSVRDRAVSGGGFDKMFPYDDDKLPVSGELVCDNCNTKAYGVYNSDGTIKRLIDQPLLASIENNFILDIDLDFFFRSTNKGCSANRCTNHLGLMLERIDWLVSFLKKLKEADKIPSIINFVYSSYNCSQGVCQRPTSEWSLAHSDNVNIFTPQCYALFCAYELKKELLKLYGLKEIFPYSNDQLMIYK